MVKHTENYCFGFWGGILEVFCASNGILLQGWIILHWRLAFRLLTPCFQLASCMRSAFFQQVLFFVRFRDVRRGGLRAENGETQREHARVWFLRGIMQVSGGSNGILSQLGLSLPILEPS